MSTVFVTFVVIVFVVLVNITTAAAAIGSKSTLSLGSGTVVARLFFFGVRDALVGDIFLLCSSPVLVLELCYSSSLFRLGQVVL